ncbi:MAG: hypothetical protein ACRDOL_45040, partial [Streptosporangiaceae bacterium]
AQRVARLREQVGAADSRSAAAQEEMDRLAVAAAQAIQRADIAQEEYDQVQDLAGGDGEDRSELAAEHERATALFSDYSERTVVLRTAEREAARSLAGQRARAEALAEAVRSGADASAALLADPARFEGVLGSFADRLQVAEGFEVAIAAALGAAADAVAVTSLEAAAEILATLRRDNAGQAGLVIAPGVPAAPTGSAPSASGDLAPISPADAVPAARGVPAAPAAPAASDASAAPAAASAPKPPAVTPAAAAQYPVPAADLVRAPGGLGEAAAELLRDVVVTADLEQARRIVRQNSAFKAVTKDGDLLGSHWAHGGAARPQSLFELRATADEAAAGLAGAQRRCDEAARELATAAQAEEAARRSAAEVLARRQRADSAAAEVSGRLGRLAGAARAARDEADRLDAAIEAATRAAEKDLARLEQLRRELLDVEADAQQPDELPEEEEEAAGGREDLADRCTAARNTEMEARLEVRTAEERLRAIDGRADSLTAAAASERQARARQAE